MTKLLVVCALIGLVVCAPSDGKNKREAVSSTTAAAPSSKKQHIDTFVEVMYGDQKIVLGNFVNASQIKDMPVVEWVFQNDTMYNLVALNLNVPTKKNSADSDYLMWMVGNIPGNDVSKGDVLAEYVGAFPIKGEGNQGVIYILNSQPNGRIDYKMDLISKTNSDARKKFDMGAFSKKFNFGYALSFNSLFAEHDEYADELRMILYPENKSSEKKQDTKSKPIEGEMMKNEVKQPMPTMDAEEEMEERCVMVPKIKKIATPVAADSTIP